MSDMQRFEASVPTAAAAHVHVPSYPLLHKNSMSSITYIFPRRRFTRHFFMCQGLHGSKNGIKKEIYAIVRTYIHFLIVHNKRRYNLMRNSISPISHITHRTTKRENIYVFSNIYFFVEEQLQTQISLEKKGGEWNTQGEGARVMPPPPSWV